MKRHIPNLITLLNLLAGCIALVMALQGELSTASWLIVLAAALDFFDGMAARLLRVKSAIGKQLDSLADVVSFGVVPGVILFMMIRQGFAGSDPGFTEILPYAAFIVPMSSAMRLARFNIDDRQEEVFYGLPTPANALLVASFPLILGQGRTLAGIDTEIIHHALMDPWVLLILTGVLSWLLVADIRLPSLKFKSTGWRDNQVRYLLLILSVLWLVLFQFAGVPLIIFTYFMLSLVMKV